MCKHLTSIGFKNGDVYTSDYTNSHEDLIDELGLKDKDKSNWSRLEYTTQNIKDLVDIEKYELRIDQEIPDWLTDEIKDTWKVKLRIIAQEAILSTNKNILLGGKWVISGKPRIGKIVNATIVYAGSARIENAGSATIEHAGSARIENAGSARIKNANSATIEYASLATIKYAGSATIKYADSATIEHAGNATIEDAGSATIVNRQYAKILNE